MLEIAVVLTQVKFGSRPGPRPETSRTLPHVQLDQWPPEAITREVIRRALALPGVSSRESRVANPAVNTNLDFG